MSHELRTPLNAIIGFSEIIHGQLFGDVGNARYLDYSSDILRSGRHLLAVINSVLDLSKSESRQDDAGCRAQPICARCCRIASPWCASNAPTPACASTVAGLEQHLLV